VQVRVVIDLLALWNLRRLLVTGTPKAAATPMERAEMESTDGRYPEKLLKWWKLFCSLCLKGRKSLVIRLSVFEWIAKRLVLTAGVPQGHWTHHVSGMDSLQITTGGSAWQAKGSRKLR
jgi:hypothetical protein